MKGFLKYLFAGTRYLVAQGIIEIIVILILEYLGFNVLLDFSKSNLFIENIQGVAWAISMKTFIFAFIYLPLFVIISFLLNRRKVKSIMMYGIINGALCVLLLLTLFLLKGLDLIEMFPPLTSTLITSFLIIVIVNKKN